MLKSILTSIVLFVAFNHATKAQADQNADLFNELRIQDSIFFDRAFNQCDLLYLEDHITEDLRFYHDQGGFQDKKVFLENVRNNLCADSEQKPIRKIVTESLEVYPLYNNGKLYGAIQNGIHNFYLRAKGKDDLWTSTAKFSHVWVIENDTWKISEVLSYEHKNVQ